MVPLYPTNVPSTVISPLLTEGALQLLHQSTSNEEKQLWASLGDSWSIARYLGMPGTGCTGTERVKMNWSTILGE